MLMWLIFSGALERFPNLKIVIGEAGLGWIPYVLQHMDLEWEDQFKDLDLKMKPSEYWYRQCYATYQTDPVGIRLLDILGEDNVMWGSDYPHPDGIWPDSQEFLDRELGGVSAEPRRKVTRDTAMKLYRLGNHPARRAASFSLGFWAPPGGGGPPSHDVALARQRLRQGRSARDMDTPECPT